MTDRTLPPDACFTLPALRCSAVTANWRILLREAPQCVTLLRCTAAWKGSQSGRLPNPIHARLQCGLVEMRQKIGIDLIHSVHCSVPTRKCRDALYKAYLGYICELAHGGFARMSDRAQLLRRQAKIERGMIDDFPNVDWTFY